MKMYLLMYLVLGTLVSCGKNHYLVQDPTNITSTDDDLFGDTAGSITGGISGGSTTGGGIDGSTTGGSTGGSTTGGSTGGSTTGGSTGGSTTGGSTGGSTTGGTTGGGTTGNNDHIVSCAQAAQDGLLITEDVSASFEEENSCDWGLNGNLSLQNAKQCVWGARKDQTLNVAVPLRAKKICGMTLNIAHPKQKYDDEMILTLGGKVVFSTQDFSSSKIDNPAHRLNKDAQGLMGYSWDILRGTPYYKDVSVCKYGNHNSKKYIEPYCHGYVYGSPDYINFCHVPKTEATGLMNITLSSPALAALSAKAGLPWGQTLNPNVDHELIFKLSTLGDDDASDDCTHGGLDIKIKFSYIE